MRKFTNPPNCLQSNVLADAFLPSRRQAKGLWFGAVRRTFVSNKSDVPRALRPEFSLGLSVYRLRGMEAGTCRAVEVAIAMSAALMLVRYVLTLSAGVSLKPEGLLDFLLPATVVAALLAARAGCARASILAGAMAIYQAANIGMVFCLNVCFYAGRAAPLADPRLAAVDSILGFDFVGYLRFIEAHHWINDLILFPAYQSIYWQSAAITAAMLLLGRSRESLVMLLAMTESLMISCLVAIFVPAYGVYHFHNVTAAMHPHLTNLSTADGVAAKLDWIRSGMVGFQPKSQGGLLTFPSFHTSCAVLFIWACRKSAVMFALSVPLNVAMLISTPLHGSHYVADMIAGAAVALPTAWAIDIVLERFVQVDALSRFPPLLFPDLAVARQPST